MLFNDIENEQEKVILKKLNLLKQQEEFFKILNSLNPELSNMYLGALYVLNDNENPEKYFQAAHSIRELIEKMYKILDIPIKALNQSLTQKVRELEDKWKNTLRNSNCYCDNVWNGEIDPNLKSLLKKLNQFFEWFENHSPRRIDEMISIIRELDVSGIVLPHELELLNASYLNSIRDFFVNVAHHRKKPSEFTEHFDIWLRQLELFVLERTKPRTFDDIKIIDKIIYEGEKNGTKQ